MIKNFLIRNSVALFNKKLRKQPLQPYPLTFWENRRAQLRKYAALPDILRPSMRTLKTAGENIPIAELRGFFDGRVLGEWTLDADSMLFLWQRLQAEKPKVIVECGSGVSTLLFARYLSLYQPDGVLLSLEQSAEETKVAQDRLEKHGLAKFVKMYHAPMVSEERGYNLNGVETWPGMQRFDWILVDGPAGNNLVRYYTIADMQKLANPGARWFLDDSFRDNELNVLSKWAELPGVKVEGIYPIGKGLSTGTIQ